MQVLIIFSVDFVSGLSPFLNIVFAVIWSNSAFCSVSHVEETFFHATYLIEHYEWFFLYTPVLVADAGPWAACQAAGGHLARLMQTLSRGLWGTCCPSGGGEAWNETTPQQVTVQHDSMFKCADDNGRACLSPADKIPDPNQKGCSVSIRYMWRYI